MRRRPLDKQRATGAARGPIPVYRPSVALPAALDVGRRRHNHGARRGARGVTAVKGRVEFLRGTREEAMRQYFGLGLGIIVGTVIGAAAVSGLHAQTKPPLFLITEIDVMNPEAYGKEFAPKAQATIKAAGARFLLIGGTAGAGAKPITAISGTPPKRVTVQVWDSLEAMNKWYNGADYQAALKIGEQYATFRRYAVEGQ